MKEENSSNFMPIEDRQAAELLTDWKKRRYLEPFMAAPKSVTAAAAELNIKLNAMHYRVGQLEALGLLRQVGQTKGKGRRVKLYAPTAPAFFVPFAATPHASLEEMMARLSALDEFLAQAVAMLTAQADKWGVLISLDKRSLDTQQPARMQVKLAPLDDEGKPSPRPVQALLAPAAAAVWAGEMTLRLEPEDAKALQHELAALSQRFEAKQSNAGKPYFVVLGMVERS